MSYMSTNHTYLANLFSMAHTVMAGQTRTHQGVEAVYRGSGNWDLYIDGAYVGTHWVA